MDGGGGLLEPNMVYVLVECVSWWYEMASKLRSSDTYDLDGLPDL
jgi:hypothetical protein